MRLPIRHNLELLVPTVVPLDDFEMFHPLPNTQLTPELIVEYNVVHPKPVQTLLRFFDFFQLFPY